MPLTTVLLRPTDASFAGSQTNYATYVKAAANNYRMGYPCTISISSGVIVAEGSAYATNAPVVFSTTGTLPTGLTAGVTYYARDVSSSTFRVSATIDGPAIALSGTQSGLHYASWPAWRTNEHNSILAFAARSAATKVFAPRSGGNPVLSGNWNVAANWSPNGVPGANDQVLIPEGVTCIYDIVSGSPDIFWIRIDGTLEIDTTANRHLLVDTILSSPSGTYQCGTYLNPVPANVDINIEFSASRGPINVAADTFKQSRGYVFMGEASCGGYTSVAGARKTHATRVNTRLGPLAGATSCTLDDVTGWRVGDRIQFPGTRRLTTQFLGANKGRWKWECEYVTITAINANTITFTPALVYNHNAPFSPWADKQPRCWVRNLTRNVTFSTKNWASVPTEQRAHGMLMHASDYYFGWATHFEMGRTAKHFTWAPWWAGNQTGNAQMTAGVPITVNTTAPGVSGSVVTLPTEAYIIIDRPSPRNGSSYPLTFTVNGTDGLGNVISDTVVMANEYDRTSVASVAPYVTLNADGTTGIIPRTDRRFKTVTSITCDKDCWTRIAARTRSFRMTGSGVRIPRGSQLDENSGSWAYFPVNAATNIQGRYPFHVHRSGYSAAAVRANPTVEGVVVDGSPGWGFAHHQAFSNLLKNIAVRVEGAGFVAERGDETGMWAENHASEIYGATDNTHKDAQDTAWGDPGLNAEAYWWTGRSVKSEDLLGDNCMCAFLFNVRFAESNYSLNAEQLDEPEALIGTNSAGSDKSRIELFKGHECFVCDQGFHVIKANFNQGHDVRTVLKDLFGWSCQETLGTTYTAHYTFINTVALFGFNDDPNDTGTGYGMVSTLTTTTDQVFIDVRIDGPRIENGFTKPVASNGSRGMFLDKGQAGGNGGVTDVRNGRVVINADIRNCQYPYFAYDPAVDLVAASLPNPNLEPKVQIDLSNHRPAIKASFPGTSPGECTYGNFGYFEGRLDRKTTVTDRLGTREYPRGWSPDEAVSDRPPRHNVHSGLGDVMRRWGVYTDTVDGKDYSMIDWLYSDPVDGEIYREIIKWNLSESQNPPGPGANMNRTPYIRGTFTSTQTAKPVAQDISITVPKDQITDINLMSYVTHPAGRPVLFRGCTHPHKGALLRGYSPTTLGSGVVTFIPRKGFVGTTTFKYWVSDVDGNLQSTFGSTVTITVADIAPGISAQPDSATTPYETPVTFNVLTNDVGSGLVLTGATVVTGGGSLTFNADGRITYTPATGFAGVATGTYTMRDVNLETRNSTWAVTVAPSGGGSTDVTPPTASNRTLRIKAGRNYTVNLIQLMGATDNDGNPVFVASATPDATVNYSDVVNTGSFTFNVRTGTTVFTVVFRDAAQNTCTVQLTVIATDRARFFRKL